MQKTTITEAGAPEEEVTIGHPIHGGSPLPPPAVTGSPSASPPQLLLGPLQTVLYPPGVTGSPVTHSQTPVRYCLPLAPDTGLLPLLSLPRPQTEISYRYCLSPSPPSHQIDLPLLWLTATNRQEKLGPQREPGRETANPNTHPTKSIQRETHDQDRGHIWSLFCLIFCRSPCQDELPTGVSGVYNNLG